MIMPTDAYWSPLVNGWSVVVVVVVEAWFFHLARDGPIRPGGLVAIEAVQLALPLTLLVFGNTGGLHALNVFKQTFKLTTLGPHKIY